MKTKIKQYLPIICIAISILLLMQCTKENFVEPIDPFETQRLEPNPQTFQLGSGNNALLLKANKASVIQTDYGYRIKGSVYIENSKYGDIRLSNGDFELVKDANGNFFSKISGLGIAELPHEGLLNNLALEGMPVSKLAFKKGSEFESGPFAWPVDPDRYYFYYENDNPYSALITKSKFQNIRKVAIDPLDPYYFTSCDFNGSKLGDLSDVGIAVSVQGLIPFTPLVTSYNIPSFKGNFYLSGTIPLNKYPIAFSGEAVLSIGSSGSNSDDFFANNNSTFKMGLNGKATLDNQVLDWLNVEVVLGKASLYLGVENSGKTQIKFVGEREMPPSTPSDFLYQVIGQDWNFLDYLVPIEQKETFYGTIGTEFSEWELGFKSESSLNILGNKIDMGHTYLEINSSSMHFSGEVVVAGLNRIGVKGYAERNGNFELTGYMSNGLSVSKGKLHFGYELSADVTLKHESGTFTFRGRVKLHGEACLSIGKIDICVDFTIRATVTISSNGNFEVCFSIGIGKLGFDVCINYESSSSVNEKFTQTMTYKEIPLELVPMENRFEPKDSNSTFVK
ncbi:MAG: hypothetical protein D4R68_03315 [Ignavibacteriales bacterium]|nr:MAG: hypothetical protein D4R68_03315 [Ignavibacteriales bacterium]